MPRRSCDLCGKTASVGRKYCQLHAIAYDEVIMGFENWKKAFVNMSWERYLESILKLSETGDASREIAKHLLKPAK